MGLFSNNRGPNLATVAGRSFTCRFCDGAQFYDREVKMNTSGMEFFDLGWANQSALGLICAQCGLVHEFMGGSVQLWDPTGGYPA
jgi:hypothetical protein